MTKTALDSISIDTKLKNKSYQDSIVILFNEIKKIFINEVKIYEKDFKYTSLKELKTKVIEYLPNELHPYFITLYSLVMNPLEEYLEFNIMLNLYKEILKITKK